jgi:hypothetical protein
VPTEAELKVETTEATKDTEKVTNLGTALDNFLRIPAAGFLNILPVLGERTVLYLNPLKFIVPLVEGSGGSLTTGSLAKLCLRMR